MSKIIGIDLGTTNSAVAVMESKSPRVIENEEGGRTTPSVVAYSGDGERSIGQAAKRQATMNPSGTIYSVKRLLGMKFDDLKDEISNLAYEVVRGKDGGCKIKVDGKLYSPEEVSAQTLLKMKRTAERYLGTTVNEAVITVPAYFNDAQRQATKDAGKIAGLDVKRIINEPTAAALAYGLDRGDDQKVAVYDLGGGTFDISILDISDNVVEVLSTNGNTHLGGDDIDNILSEWMISSFSEQHGMDISNDKVVIQRVKEAAEKAKVELSAAQSTDISLPFLTADSTGPKHLNLSLTRSSFEQMIDSFVESTLQPVKNALKDAGLEPSDIDEILMVGGSTRTPAVRSAVEEFFGKATSSAVNPDEVVALGAAVQAGVFSGDVTDILLLDVTPLSLGIETLGGVMTALIERNTTIPSSKSQVFSTAEDNQSSVDIKVLQGERKFSSDNMILGTFMLSGIPSAPRGVPQIEVAFDIDANGIVSVSATDKATNKVQSITVAGTGGLSDSDIEKMVGEAKENEEEDNEKFLLIEKRNSLDSLVYQATKSLDDCEDEALSQDINDSISSSRSALDSDNLDLLSGEFSKLESLLHRLAEVRHTDSTDSTANGTSDNIVDAEFEEVESDGATA
jgi:molecular chaperone DnaK